MGSTARHRAPRSSKVSLTLPFSMIATALAAAVYRRIIRTSFRLAPSRGVVNLSRGAVLASVSEGSVCDTVRLPHKACAEPAYHPRPTVSSHREVRTDEPKTVGRPGRSLLEALLSLDKPFS